MVEAFECEECGSEENITSCTYCGQTLCQDCCNDHEPECEDSDAQ